MKKYEIFTFTAPNGAEMTAVVVEVIEATIPAKVDPYWKERVMMYICYAQNRLFTMTAKIEGKFFINKVGTPEYGEVIVDYCILPDYDAMLERYSDSQVTSAEEQNNM